MREKQGSATLDHALELASAARRLTSASATLVGVQDVAAQLKSFKELSPPSGREGPLETDGFPPGVAPPDSWRTEVPPETLERVRRFGSFTADLRAIAHWLRQCGVTTVALESTGVYWIPLFDMLQEEGFVASYEVAGEPPRATLAITLKSSTPKGRALSGLRRISKPGLRVYAGKTELPRVLGGLGIAIISTSHGLMSGRAAKRAGLGGEVVAYVW